MHIVIPLPIQFSTDHQWLIVGIFANQHIHVFFTQADQTAVAVTQRFLDGTAGMAHHIKRCIDFVLAQRFSLIGGSVYLEDFENYSFWIIFFLGLVMTNIIFLNFVIAEAGNSYNEVKECLEQFILREKAALIDEAEQMIPRVVRSDKWYPKYVIVREFDN